MTVYTTGKIKDIGPYGNNDEGLRLELKLKAADTKSLKEALKDMYEGCEEKFLPGFMKDKDYLKCKSGYPVQIRLDKVIYDGWKALTAKVNGVLTDSECNVELVVKKGSNGQVAIYPHRIDITKPVVVSMDDYWDKLFKEAGGES